jgi:hypothetical protein
LFLVTLLVGGGLFAGVILYGKDRVPTGSYPLAFVLIPVLIGVAIFFVVVELVLRLFGIRVWAETKDSARNGGPGTPPSDSGAGHGPPSVS